MQELENAYRVLDLEPGASLEDINQSYKDLVFIWHPDRLPKDNTRLIEKAQEKIKQLNQARDYLRTHAREGTQAHSNSGYRSRTRTYSRAYQNSGYRRQANDNDAAEATKRRPYTNPYKPYQSRYAQSAYGTYGSYPSASNGRSSGADAQTPPSPESNSNGYHRSYTSGAQNSYARTSNGANPPQTERQDGWNNYTTRPPSSGSQSYDRDRSSNGSGYRSSYGTGRDRAASVPKPHSTGARARQQNPDLSGADFRGADLREKDFSGRNLSSADLSGADLQDAFLHRVNLNRANLSKANLFRANLLQANLSHANLRGANLIGADLSGADLSGADLSGAKVSVGDRIMVKLTSTVLQGTIMPDGTINA